MKQFTSAIDSVLKSAGFRRSRSVWNRAVGEFVDVIDLQCSKSNDLVTMNLGVVYPKAYTACWGEPLPSYVVEPRATVRIRIGHLLGVGDQWWPRETMATNEAILTALTEHALPFFDRMHSLEAIERLLTDQSRSSSGYPPPSIYLAAIKHSLGDASGACELLTSLREATSGPWGTKIAHAETFLGCR
ncbi:MAG: hypothetical protein QOJ45_284 [Verrucomicrobiota bacterium]|jgi:hypothetical protein